MPCGTRPLSVGNLCARTSSLHARTGLVLILSARRRHISPMCPPRHPLVNAAITQSMRLKVRDVMWQATQRKVAVDTGIEHVTTKDAATKDTMTKEAARRPQQKQRLRTACRRTLWRRTTILPGFILMLLMQG